MSGTTLPVFIRAEYDGQSRAFADFERSALEAGSKVKGQFERDFAEINRILTKAISLPSGAAGGLDLDVASMKQAATEADRAARAKRAFAQAAEEAARATNDASEETRRYVQAARAVATEAEKESRALAAKASTEDQRAIGTPFVG